MTGQDYIKRLNELKSSRAPLEQFWREAYDNTYPLRGQKFGAENLTAETAHTAAEGKNARIYDSTAKRSIRLFVSALLSGISPANSLWLGLDIFNLGNDKEGKEWLDGSAKTIWQNIHASNYDVAAYEAFLDIIIAGMFAIYITEGEKESGQPYVFQQWPLYSLYCADSTGKGAVDTIYRSFTLSAEQAVNEYGDEVSDQIKKVVEKKPDQRFDFIQAIYPRKKPKKLELPIASVHVELKGKNIVRESGYEEMPVVVPRWCVIPDSVYSVGPIDDALPDIKSLNEVVKMILSNADLAIAGMWGAVDDGVLNTKSVKVGPRKVIAVANKDSFFSLKSGTDFNIGFAERDSLQKSVREILMSDQLQPQDGPAMTATEVHIRTQLVRQLLGPMYGRLQCEFLKPLVERCFGIAFRAGALGNPPQSIKDRIIHVTYASPLAKAQKIEDVGAMDRFEQSLLIMAKDGITAPVDVYDFDGATRERADLLGVPAKLLRDEKAVKELRDKRSAAIKQQHDEMQKVEMQKAIVVKGTQTKK